MGRIDRQFSDKEVDFFRPQDPDFFYEEPNVLSNPFSRAHQLSHRRCHLIAYAIVLVAIVLAITLSVLKSTAKSNTTVRKLATEPGSSKLGYTSDPYQVPEMSSKSSATVPFPTVPSSIPGGLPSTTSHVARSMAATTTSLTGQGKPAVIFVTIMHTINVGQTPLTMSSKCVWSTSGTKSAAATQAVAVAVATRCPMGTVPTSKTSTLVLYPVPYKNPS